MFQLPGTDINRIIAAKLRVEDFFQWYWTESCDEDIEMYNRRLNTPAKGCKQVDQFIKPGVNYTKPDAPLDQQYKVTYSGRSAHGVEEFSSRTVRNVAQHWDDTPDNTKRQLNTFEASYVASGTVCFFLLTVYWFPICFLFYSGPSCPSSGCRRTTPRRWRP